MGTKATMNGRWPHEASESGAWPACDAWGRRCIFRQNIGVPSTGPTWTAPLGRASDSRPRFTVSVSRIPQIGARRHVTSADTEESLGEFLKRYPSRPYRRRGAGDYPAAELVPVTAADGLLYLNEVPAQMPHGSPRRSDADDGHNCHLWVIDERGRPCIAQEPLARLDSCKLHHTNLTGGGKASIGGEIWFGALPFVHLSGSSGRYPPTERDHLEGAERLFRAVGFDVHSLGWDSETDQSSASLARTVIDGGEMSEFAPTLFVRGKYQLARYEHGSSATGRCLTEHEVLQAYGRGVLAEIDDHLSAVLLARADAIEQAIHQQRVALGVTHDQLASAAKLDREIVELAETDAEQLGLREIERLAFVLGLDPAKLSIDDRAGSDPELGVRLRVLEIERVPTPTSARLTPRTVLRFSEAASIIRSQLLLQHWLGKQNEAGRFETSPDYGPPAWQAGYALARRARELLGVGLEPIESMRDLVEGRLGIPVIQVELPQEIAGATISSHGQRGIVLNVAGRNSNVWIRRTTLAHELAHILFDPEERLSNVRVDSYDQIARDARRDGELPDPVEQRANAFAIEFLAPRDAVRQFVSDPAQVSAASVEQVMSKFGVGKAAARFHVGNSWWGQAELPPESGIRSEPTYEQKAAEDFTLDYFEPNVTPEQRRGRFAFLAAEAVQEGLITNDTAAQYLACTEKEMREALPILLSLS